MYWQRRQKTAQVVIGAQFGDEGKGRWIDQYAAEMGDDSIVIRFNGGAQAGHTVVAPDGTRHVFSHLGSGTLIGSATFLSRFFVSNPILFLKELDLLCTKGTAPVVYADPQGLVTTPYDMMLNQIIEQQRGVARHGSCGIGFGETIERNLISAYALTVADLVDSSTLADKLDAIRREYAPTRLKQQGLSDAFTHSRGLFLSDAILARFLADVQRFGQWVHALDLKTATEGQQVLFEGAQGLLLDQDRGFFPHVTRSHTGLRNVLPLAAELNITQLDVTYATRPYVTRHGAGPLAHELPEKPYPGVIDATNVPNDWQGTLRFGWLDLDVLHQAITTDLVDARQTTGLKLRPRIAISCLDQVADEKITYFRGGVRHRVSSADLRGVVGKSMEFIKTDDILLSFGPGRTSPSTAHAATGQAHEIRLPTCMAGAV